ncbi:hypothetical protein J5X98_03370 [Leptothermofonsia sichuanensis E412]|uniref:hypothetical protein n=1 Tax=Leptothermofonsia sichuanensis TaxID=2917832 RepID=UPI001CA6E698|nr:hypothetical protein [Leptothermofonsia sichuanensis]QZZ21520.1 hypothetical protein J5X98_03370 [Leptothermofonsia sichuanensis E412]
MAFSQSQVIGQPDYILMLKSFVLWMGILTVCLLIIGFPLGILIVAFGSVLALVLHAVMPGFGILLVAGSFIGVQLIGVMLVSAMLAVKGVHPKNVTWLRWMNGDENPKHESQYASCPLTCGLER